MTSTSPHPHRPPWLRTHRPDARRTRRATRRGTLLGAVYDVATAAAEAVSAEHGGFVAGDPHELINSDQVDAVAICSSTDTHIDLLVAAAEAGKPVFLEKPVHLDLGEVDRGWRPSSDQGSRSRSASTGVSTRAIARCGSRFGRERSARCRWCESRAAILRLPRSTTSRCRAASSST